MKLNMNMFICSLIMVIALPAFAGAESLGDVAGNITNSMTGIAKLITATSYVAGVGFALMGMFKFKAHKDNPQQIPLSQPIVLLVISAGLIFLPSLISTSGATIWGQQAKSSDAQGSQGDALAGLN